jgi:hypothetical protein
MEARDVPNRPELSSMASHQHVLAGRPEAQPNPDLVVAETS